MQPEQHTIVFCLQKFIVLTCIFLCLSFSVHATDPVDIVTGLKTVLLMNDRPGATLNVGIVFDPANPTSQSDADAIKSAIDSGAIVLSGLKLTATLVSASDTVALAGVKVAFLSNGLSSHDFDAVSHIAVPAGILTISTDLHCAESGKCVLGIVSRPSVEIYYNSAAAEASHIRFVSAFLMLVKSL